MKKQIYNGLFLLICSVACGGITGASSSHSAPTHRSALSSVPASMITPILEHVPITQATLTVPAASAPSLAPARAMTPIPAKKLMIHTETYMSRVLPAPNIYTTRFLPPEPKKVYEPSLQTRKETLLQNINDLSQLTTYTAEHSHMGYLCLLYSAIQAIKNNAKKITETITSTKDPFTRHSMLTIYTSDDINKIRQSLLHEELLRDTFAHSKEAPYATAKIKHGFTEPDFDTILQETIKETALLTSMMRPQSPA